MYKFPSLVVLCWKSSLPLAIHHFVTGIRVVLLVCWFECCVCVAVLISDEDITEALLKSFIFYQKPGSPEFGQTRRFLGSSDEFMLDSLTRVRPDYPFF